MNCNYCNMEAAAICFCSKIHLCAIHLGHHILSKGNHPYEPINYFLKHDKFPLLKQKIERNIELIQEAQTNISKETKSFIKKIENLHKECIQSLNAKIEYLSNLLKINKFCKRDFTVINKICEEDLVIIELHEIEVDDDVESFFKQAFLAKKQNLPEVELNSRKEDMGNTAKILDINQGCVEESKLVSRDKNEGFGGQVPYRGDNSGNRYRGGNRRTRGSRSGHSNKSPIARAIKADPCWWS